MSLDFDVFVVDPKPVPSAVPGFEDAVGPATWPPSTSTLISDDGGALLVDCLITAREGRRLAALEADTLIAGHRNPLAGDDDARRQIAECRRYIADFEAALERSEAPAELIDRMTAAYPDLANPYTLWVGAYDLLGPAT
jgi:hypothetical protein